MANKPRTFIRKSTLETVTSIRPMIDGEVAANIPTVEDIIKEIKANFAMWTKTDKSYTRLVKRAVNACYYNNAPAIMDEFILRMKQCANVPQVATAQVLKDICGISFRMEKDDNGNIIAVRSSARFTTPEEIKAMNETLSGDFIIKNYKRTPAPKEKEDKFAAGGMAFILNVIADNEKKISKEMENGDNSHSKVLEDFEAVRAWINEQIQRKSAM